MLYPVANAEAFTKGKIDTFDQVGFRVLDDWRQQITLTNPTPYFLSFSLIITPGFPCQFPRQTGWSNADYDRLISEANQTGDQAARYAAFQKAEASLLEDAPILPVYFYTHAFLIRPSVQRLVSDDS